MATTREKRGWGDWIVTFELNTVSHRRNLFFLGGGQEKRSLHYCLGSMLRSRSNYNVQVKRQDSCYTGHECVNYA